MVATFVMRGERDRDFALRFVQRLPLDSKNEVVIRRVRRSKKQERRFRSMAKAIMDAGKTFGGREWDSDNWRRIFISAYLTEKGEEVGTVVEGMEGEFLVLGDRRGSDLSVDEWNEMMAYMEVWMAKNGVVWEEKDIPTGPEPPTPNPEDYR